MKQRIWFGKLLIGLALWLGAASGGAMTADADDCGCPRPFLPMGTSTVRDLKWSPDGTRIAASDYDTTTVWDVKAGAPISEFEGWVPGWIDDRTLSAVKDRYPRAVDAATGADVTFPSTVPFKQFRAWRGRTAIVDRRAGPMQVFDLDLRKPLRTLDESAEAIGVDISFDGTRATALCADGSLRAWEIATGKLIYSVPTDHVIINAVISESRDGQLVAVNGGCWEGHGDRDKSVSVYDARSGKGVFRTESVPLLQVRQFQWCLNGDLLILTERTGVTRWRRDNEAGLRQINALGRDWREMSLSPDGRTLALAGRWDRRVDLLNVASEKVERTLELPLDLRPQHFPDRSEWLSWIGNDRLLIEGSRSSSILDTTTGSTVFGTEDAVLSTDQMGVWFHSGGRTAYRRSFRTGHANGAMETDKKPYERWSVPDAAFNGDELEVQAGKLSLQRDWQHYGHESTTLEFVPKGGGHKQSVLIDRAVPVPRLVGATSDGKWVALSVYYHGYDDNRVIWLFDRRKGKVAAILRGHNDRVLWSAWSPDAMWVATLAYDGSVGIWNARTGELLARHYPQNLGKDWLTITPQGYYTVSRGGRSILQWRCGGRLWDEKRYRERFERPELVREALAVLN